MVCNSRFKKALIYRKGENGIEQIADAKWGKKNWDSFEGHISEISGGRERKNYDLENRRKNQEDMEFIHSLANWLDMANNEHVFDRLVIVASPKTLGHIRGALSRNVQNRVTQEVDKDLTKFTFDEISKHLEQIGF